MVEKVSAFFVGNVVGLAILVGGVLITAPKKLKETESIQKQQAALKEQAAQAARDSATRDPATTATDSATAKDLSAKDLSTTATDPVTAMAPAAAKDSASPAEHLAPYVVSKVNIARGVKIEGSAIKLEKLPAAGNQNALRNVDSVVGKTTIVDIHAGDTITAKALKN